MNREANLKEIDSEAYVKMMEKWIDAAKQCSQLSAASLILPIFFLRDIGGINEGTALWDSLNWWFYLAWALLGLTVLLSITYQITAARLIGDKLSRTTTVPIYPKTQFTFMTVFLMLGLFSFVVGAASLEQGTGSQIEAIAARR